MGKTIERNRIGKRVRNSRLMGKGLVMGIVCLGLLLCSLSCPEPVRADNVVVVIDPGHGGENEGGKTDVYLEKEMTMKVAQSMKTELEKYEGITVYLTRESDVDMSLQERVDYAAEVGADFIYSIHFNMSEYHELYGTECWISAFGSCYAKGYDFAKICNSNLASTGLANRGIKTRLGKKGKDYYGIIRAATEYELPSCIIEHCHMDNANDAPYLDTDEWPEYYGGLDATSVAQYFGLKSSVLGVDYSGMERETTPIPAETKGPDITGPEYLSVDSLVKDPKNGVIHAVISAKESDSKMMYYAYSTDGGGTMTPRLLWPEGAETILFDIPLPEDGQGSLVIRVLNNYDLKTDSPEVDIASIRSVESDSGEETVATGADPVRGQTGEGISGFQIFRVFLAVVAATLLLFLAVVVLWYRKGKMPGRKAGFYSILLVTEIGLLCVFIAILGKVQNAGVGKANSDGDRIVEEAGVSSTEQTLQPGMEGDSGQIAGQNIGLAPQAETEEEVSLEDHFYACPLDEELKNKITGLSYPADDTDAKISYDELRYVHVLYIDFDGKVAEGELICHRDIAQDLVEIFQELYLQRYPIERICLVDEYGADDEASMEANNTSCFNYRVIYGTDHLSNHSYGKAIDINPFYNPYVFSRNGEIMVQPAGAEAYVDRSAENPYAIDEEDLCYQLFIQHGFQWGGNWSNSKDYQHFEKQ